MDNNKTPTFLLLIARARILYHECCFYINYCSVGEILSPTMIFINHKTLVDRKVFHASTGVEREIWLIFLFVFLSTRRSFPRISVVQKFQKVTPLAWGIEGTFRVATWGPLAPSGGRMR